MYLDWFDCKALQSYWVTKFLSLGLSTKKPSILGVSARKQGVYNVRSYQIAANLFFQLINLLLFLRLQCSEAFRLFFHLAHKLNTNGFHSLKKEKKNSCSETCSFEDFCIIHGTIQPKGKTFKNQNKVDNCF